MSETHGIITETTVAAGERRILTFRLADEDFGVSVMRVVEIISAAEITRVPRMPRFFRGVISQRGRIIPIIDLRRKLGMADADATRETCIIVTERNGDPMGMYVDKTTDVIDADETEIQPPPEFGMNLDTSFLQGVVRRGDRVVFLLDIDRTLSLDELKKLLRRKRKDK